MIHFRTIDSPIGLLTLAGRGQVLTNLRMVDQTYEPKRTGWSENPTAFDDVVDQLEAYFAGELTDFELEFVSGKPCGPSRSVKPGPTAQ
jgi:methylated-DNA-[protein]-cysteine S-methyltransferase